MLELVGITLMGAGIIFLLIQAMDLKGIMVSNDKFGPSGFPQFVMIISLFLLGYILFMLLRRKDIKVEEAPAARKKALLIHVFIFLLYLLFLDIIGFVLATLLFSYVGVTNLGYSHKVKALLFSLVITCGVTFVFGRVFFISLPRGLGLIRDLSYLFY